MSIYTGDSSTKVSRKTKGTDILNSLLLDQYKNSPNLIEYYMAFIQEMDFLFESVEDVYLGMMLESAVGDQLDKIGALLGQSRSVDLPEIYFGFQGSSQSEGFSDEGDPTSGGIFRDGGSSNTDILSDDIYRRILLSIAIVSTRDTCDINLAYYIITVLLGRVPAKIRLEDVGVRDIRLVLGEGEVTTNEILLILFAAPLFVPLGVRFNVITEIPSAVTIEASSSFNSTMGDGSIVGNTYEASSTLIATQTYITGSGDIHEVSSVLSVANSFNNTGEIAVPLVKDYHAAVVADSPYLLSTFNDYVSGSSINDEINNNDGTSFAFATTTGIVENIGPPSIAATMGAYNSYIFYDTAIAGLHTVANNPWTIEFWISTTDEGLLTCMFSIADDYGFGQRLSITNNFGILDAKINNGSAQSSGVTINDGVPHQVVVTTSVTGQTKLYIDGVVAITGTYIEALNFTFCTYGAFSEGGEPGSTFVGDMDTLAMYKTELTSTQVNNHYINGTV